MQTYYPEDDRGSTKQPEQKDREHTDSSNPMAWCQLMPYHSKHQSHFNFAITYLQRPV